MAEMERLHFSPPLAADTTAPIEPSLYRVLSFLLPPDETVGVREISRRLTGSDSKAAVRSMFHRLEHTNTYPAYKVGSKWAVSLTCVFAKNWAQQRNAFTDDDKRALGLIHMLMNSASPLYANAALGKCSAQDLAQLALISSKTMRLIERLLGDPG